MTTHKAGTRKEWLAARLQLLTAEKEHTRRAHELAQRRQQLPWVRIDGLWGMYQWLDRAPLGRNEPDVWWRRHDEYPVKDR